LDEEPALFREIERPSCKPLWLAICVLAAAIVVLLVWVVLR